MLIVLCIDSVCHCIISGASVLSSVKQKLGGVLLLRVDGEEAPNSMPTFFLSYFCLHTIFPVIGGVDWLALSI